MGTDNEERPAILVIDMVKDNFDERKNLPITPLARRIIDPINRLTEAFREEGWPVVFPTDAFRPEDFIFTGKLKPYSLEGTAGGEVVDALTREEGDLWLPKPRFSAFFKSGLEEWLKERGVTLCAVAGMTTNFCVLTTAMDALCCDFKAVILEDCSVAYPEKVHEQTLSNYRRNSLYPLFKIGTSTQLLAELRGEQ